MDELTRIRKRIPKSCRRCHRRKQRCVGSPICTNCQAANQACLRSDQVPSWHHGMSKGALVERIELLEAQLASLVEVEGTLSDSAEPEPSQLEAADHDTRRKIKKRRTSLSRDDSGSAVMHLLIQGSDSDNTLRPEANYLGPSSGLSIAENISRIVQDSLWTESILPVNESNEPIAPFDPEPLNTTPPPDDVTGARILDAYFKSIHLRLPFVDKTEIYQLHSHRHDPVGHTPHEQFGRFRIFMVYAIGAAILKMTETYDSTPPRHFFSTALQFEPSVRESLSIASVEALMLLSMYHQQSSASASLWYITGQAMRICVDFGLHREAQYRRLRPYEAERRRRLFWSVYLNERAIAWSLGRPFSVADEEIDAEMPADVDDAVTDDGAVAEMLRNPRDPGERVEGPNVRCFIALLRLQRIMARVRTRIYRVDRGVASLVPEIQPVLDMLEEYRRSIPALSPYENDFIHMHWSNSFRVLLQPFLSILGPEDPLIRTCLHASGQMCQYFKRLRQRDSTWYSFLLVNSVFMAGLTMCLCLFRSPRLWTTSVSNDLRACSSALFIMAERNPSVRKYRDALETVINRVMEYVGTTSPSNQGQPTSTSTSTATATRAYTHSSPSQTPTIESLLMQPVRKVMDQSGSVPGTGPGPGSGTGFGLDIRTPALSADVLQVASGSGDTTGLPTPDPRQFPALFMEDFWAGDAFSLHLGM